MPAAEGFFPKSGGDPPFDSEYNNFKSPNALSGLSATISTSGTEGWTVPPEGVVSGTDLDYTTVMQLGSMIYDGDPAADQTSGTITYDLGQNVWHYQLGIVYDWAEEGFNAAANAQTTIEVSPDQTDWIGVGSFGADAQNVGAVGSTIVLSNLVSESLSGAKFRYVRTRTTTAGPSAGSLSMGIRQIWTI